MIISEIAYLTLLAVFKILTEQNSWKQTKNGKEINRLLTAREWILLCSIRSPKDAELSSGFLLSCFPGPKGIYLFFFFFCIMGHDNVEDPICLEIGDIS